MKFIIPFFAIGPALLSFSLAYLALHPEDWTGPAVIGPIALILTIITHSIGFKKYKSLFGLQLGSLIGGLAVGPMLYFLDLI